MTTTTMSTIDKFNEYLVASGEKKLTRRQVEVVQKFNDWMMARPEFDEDAAPSDEAPLDRGEWIEEQSGEGLIRKNARMPDYCVRARADGWAAFHRFELLTIRQEFAAAQSAAEDHAIEHDGLYTPANCDICQGHHRPEELAAVEVDGRVELRCDRCADNFKPAKGFAGAFSALKTISENDDKSTLETAAQDHVTAALKSLAAAQAILGASDPRSSRIDQLIESINNELFDQ